MNHHYIPQFYLRPWLGSDHKLQEFRRGYGGRIQVGRYGTKVTGCAEDLYTVPGVTEATKYNVERMFMSLVDDDAVKARNMLLNDQIPKDPNIRHSWARFILSLILRNPEELDRFKIRFNADLMKPDAVLQAKYEAHKRVADPELLEEWMVMVDPTYAERAAVIAMTKLVENQRVLALIRNMQWYVFETSSVSRRLMTSDRPVVMTNGFGRFDGHCGIAISPTKLFVGFTFHDYAQMFLNMPTGRLVRAVNDAVIGQARKYVYALDASNVAEVRRGMGKKEAPSFVRGIPEEYLRATSGWTSGETRERPNEGAADEQDR